MKAGRPWWAQDAAAGAQAGGKKKRFVPEQLEHIQRDGPDYRQDRDVGGQDYMDAFGFKGGEFGNWMSQNDRQASLNMGFDALKDLADALKISDKDISYQGSLSIAFGARGSGNAVAHYEPMRRVINLTKMRGAGSLAHEWWHGLDDYIGQKLGAKGFISENSHKHPLFQKIIGSVRAYIENDTALIGKLIVHPKYQGQGIGTALLYAIEQEYTVPRYELFTSDKSMKNIKLYERLGYRRFKEQRVNNTISFVYLEKHRTE